MELEQLGNYFVNTTFTPLNWDNNIYKTYHEILVFIETRHENISVFWKNLEPKPWRSIHSLENLVNSHGNVSCCYFKVTDFVFCSFITLDPMLYSIIIWLEIHFLQSSTELWKTLLLFWVVFIHFLHSNIYSTQCVERKQNCE